MPDRFPHKPAAPSVRDTILPTVEHSRALSTEPRSERPMTHREVAADVMRKLDLPDAIKRDLRKRYDLDE